MFTQVMCRLYLLCLMGIFLLGAALEPFCENEYVCIKEYSQEFNFGGIRRIVFAEKVLSESYKEKLKTAYYDRSRKEIEESYPDYYLSFEIVGEPRAINFKSVIFDGVEAEVSIFSLYDHSAQLAGIKDFQMGKPDVNPNFLKVIFPIPVHNTFTIHLRRRFVDKLKARDKIKIALTTHYDKEFVVETDNFIRKYEF
ncbi:hypothetical protein BHO_0000100 (plasmid) [Borrelia hermsii YBT]|uniref:hypothetical protein n=1 Tax=Borrelia hermsii TaxID=140 RepID=UPI0003E34097|nr:hypothetical protein [Borrelia hermsii]AHH12963.1 hypothetical protein BHO_0000100 [Borrelia hermsii YBT]